MPETLPPSPPNPLGAPGRLGRKPARSDPRALHVSRFMAATMPPDATNFWDNRRPFLPRSFGNLQYGDCTRAKQAVAHYRMERLETRRTIEIADEEVVRVYVEMSDRLYGGGDNGAYETDALDCWRRPEYTFRDTKGRALTIDSYLRVNPYDQDELRAALYAAGPHGIAICINLPWGFSSIEPPRDWDFPDGTNFTGEWEPGSWGGHSMWASDYDTTGLWLEHTWELPRQRITWRAAAAYIDEAHVVIDSYDYWRAHKPGASALLDLHSIRQAVNRVSSLKIP